MGKVILIFQHTLIEDRQILDAILFANEAVDSRINSSNGCELDIENALNHINEDFLVAIMEMSHLTTNPIGTFCPRINSFICKKDGIQNLSIFNKSMLKD